MSNNSNASIPGVLMEISGIGTLITGKSGIGKSEAALDLIKLGHQLVSDDLVDITKKENGILLGEAPSKLKGFMEIRGIGIVNYVRMFGINSFSPATKLDLVCQLEEFDNQKDYDRVGLENEKITILGVQLPLVTIPVFSGRNIGLLVESAAFNQKLKLLGYDSALEFTESKGE